MGFAYQKGQTRFYLAESTHNVAFRTTYLRKKLANRSDAGAPLLPEVYLDESFCNLNHSPGKTWVDETLLFTPPYHPELQPIEVVWGVVKNRIGVRPSKDMGELRTRLELEFSSIESSHWLGAYRKAQSFEDMYFSTAEDALLGDEASDADSDLLRESCDSE
ncbi:hypothetical protein DYB26_005501 [Aphanomyces astaci]|uniref:Tc1-like transposase DDE domain-containing protein n=1 Tax=Aphanomyces astaci TaxID=112090 RepID=A0A3R7AC09_APHAT|nr:hypothetical protein DYB26_005501 [Aphanomyces astaci]